MHAYAINLDRSPDRRAHIIAELGKAGLDYEIIRGVDGIDLDLHDPAIVDPSLLTSPFLAGRVGCALSHLRAYEKIVADGLSTALVLEDDVTVPADLDSLADALADHLTGAEVALLNYDSMTPFKMSREGSIRLPAARLFALPIDVQQPRSAAAYIITQEACKRIIEVVPPVRVNSDDWWFFYREGVLDRVRCIAPLAVVKNPKFGSTIGQYGLGSGVKTHLLKPFLRHNIPFLHQVISYRRQRIFSQWAGSEVVDMPFIEKPSRLE